MALGSAFPYPIYNTETRRPFYDEEAQKLCLEVRRRNCGIDGRPILFYARRPITTAAPRKKRSPNFQKLDPELLGGLKSLGLVVTSPQVEAVVKFLFPRGVQNIDPGEVVRSVFMHLKPKAS